MLQRGKNHRVTRWPKAAFEGPVIVDANEREVKANGVWYFEGLPFDCRGNLYFADYNNHRVETFDIQ